MTTPLPATPDAALPPTLPASAANDLDFFIDQVEGWADRLPFIQVALQRTAKRWWTVHPAGDTAPDVQTGVDYCEAALALADYDAPAETRALENLLTLTVMSMIHQGEVSGIEQGFVRRLVHAAVCD